MKVEQSNLLENLQNKNVKKEGQGIQDFVSNDSGEVGFAGAFAMDIKKADLSESGNIKGKDMTYHKPEASRNIAEEVDKSQLMDANMRHNQMAVLANTVSPEDMKKLEEEGYPLISTDSKTITTVVDKIKINMAKTGGDVDLSDVDKEELKEVLGSEILASKLSTAFKEADLPETKENVEEAGEALKQLASMEALSEEAMNYLLKNDQPPTIEGIYMAEHSASSMSTVSMEEASKSYEELEPQIEEFLSETDLPLEEGSKNQCKWMIANEIPLTRDNMEKLQVLEEIGIALTEDGGVDFSDAMGRITDAISKGMRPGDANLSDITRSRKREEARLEMTAEANLTNEKKGFEQIELKPIEESVNSLKKEEETYYENLLKSHLKEGELTEENLTWVKEKANLAVTSREVFEELKQAPAYTLNRLVEDEETSIRDLHQEGQKLGQALQKAGQSYETLMTAPRKDMGDSIQKAFRNVDDILSDLKLEPSEENRRAVRILAYNETELTEENIEKVKAADAIMQRSFRAMSPAVTLEMIRRNENPLEMNLSDLIEKAEAIGEEMGYKEERFHKFLWKLEQKQEITAEERESYIGVYRLFAQIEKADGAALGSLLNQGSDLTMKNLLTAVRNKKKSGMDYKVDDSFGGITGKRGNEAIDEQINRAFRYQKDEANDILENINEETAKKFLSLDWENMTVDQVKSALTEFEAGGENASALNEQEVNEQAYEKAQLGNFGQIVESNQEVFEILERFDMDNTMLNAMALQEYLRKPNAIFDSLFNKRRQNKTANEMVADLKDQVLEEFGEALHNPKDLGEAVDALAEVAENVMKTMIMEEENISSVDLRQLQIMCKQFSFASKQSKEESYVIPIETADGVSGVSLKIVRGSQTKGLVDLLFKSELMGKIAASFKAKENQVSGMIAVDNQETRQLISDHLSMIAGIFQENGGEAIDLSVAYMPDMDFEKASRNQLKFPVEKNINAENNNENSSTADYVKEKEIQTSRLYGIAASFIQTLQELNDNGSYF